MSGWDTRPLGEICTILDNLRRPITKRDRVAGPYPYYGATGIKDYVAGFIFDEPLVLIGEDGAKWEAGENSAFPVSGRCWVNNHAHVLRPHRDCLLDQWLIYNLNWRDLSEFVSGMTVPKLNQGQLREIPIPLPPLAEQRRIVTILDEAFAGLTRMRANADANVKKARALFDSYLNTVFSEGREGWRKRTVGEVAHFASGGTPSKSNPSFWEGSIPWVSGRDMKSELLSDTQLHVSSSALDGSATRLVPAGTLLMLVRGMGLANGIAVAELLKPCAFNQDIKAIKPLKGIYPRFLLRAIKYHASLDTKLTSNAAHGTLKIDFDRLKTLTISLPDFEAQKRISAELEQVSVSTSNLVEKYLKRLSAIDALQQSILAKAFAGEFAIARVAMPAVSSAAVSNDNRLPTAVILVRSFARHRRSQRDKSFGHVKAQKILHMVEAVAGYELGRAPIKDAAGPNDMAHMSRAERWAEYNRYFRFPQIAGGGYRLEPLEGFDALLRQVDAIEPATLKAVDRVIDIFIPMDRQEAELFATIYAAWNNLLLNGETPSDDAIIREAREDWHRDKLKIDRSAFFATLAEVRRSGMIPTGKGKRVDTPQMALGL